MLSQEVYRQPQQWWVGVDFHSHELLTNLANVVHHLHAQCKHGSHGYYTISEKVTFLLIGYLGPTRNSLENMLLPSIERKMATFHLSNLTCNF